MGRVGLGTDHSPFSDFGTTRTVLGWLVWERLGAVSEVQSVARAGTYRSIELCHGWLGRGQGETGEEERDRWEREERERERRGLQGLVKMQKWKGKEGAVIL